MSFAVTLAMAIAATLFVALSATMNAVFLSSLGRTELESGLLAIMSIASDIAKAALPVVIVRTIALRAWTHTAGAAVMLLLVIASSLASGTGFAALTRNTATATRQAQVDALSAAKRELRDIEARLDLIPLVRPAAVIDAELAAALIDRRWTASKSCTDIPGPSARQFCGEVLKYKAERAASVERDNLTAVRANASEQLERLARVGSTEGDPQATAVAQLFGVDTSTPRLVLTSFMAIVIEFGSVILILLVSGPALRGWGESKRGRPQRPLPVTLPLSKDVAHWHQRREAASLTSKRSMDHA
jgi:hypothetical protein